MTLTLEVNLPQGRYLNDHIVKRTIGDEINEER